MWPLNTGDYLIQVAFKAALTVYVQSFIEHAIRNNEGESISNQPNLFPVEIHLFFFDVIAL